MLISQRKSERDSVNPDLGSDHSNGFAVSIILFRITLSLIWYCFCIDHAHPTFVTGHPFKGGAFFSTGYLAHPDMKLFALNDSTLFVPPRPDVFATALGIGAGVQ